MTATTTTARMMRRPRLHHHRTTTTTTPSTSRTCSLPAALRRSRRPTTTTTGAVVSPDLLLLQTATHHFAVLADAAAATETTSSSAVEFGKFAGDKGSYWASLGLVILTAPGLWSLVKRSPKASVKSMTFQVPGPAQGGELDAVASTVASHFARYNYEIVETGEVITFRGVYEANRGQGIALAFYVFLGLASIALVLSIINSEVGGWWYSLLLLTPLSYTYYMSNGTRTEEAKVKMVTSDDDKWAEVIVQCDKEELERFAKETGFVEKGKVKVKGLLEDTPLVQSSSTEARGFGNK